MRSAPAALIVLAVVLAGCPAPMFNALARDGATEARGRFVDLDRTCLKPTERRPLGAGTCAPNEFQALVASAAPDRVEAETWAGERVRGRALVLRADTAHLDGRPVPLADLRRVTLVDAPSPSRVLEQFLIPTATVAALGAVAGLANPDATVGQGAAIGAGIGLALGVSLGRPAETQRFEVVGWAAPPWPDNRLDVAQDGCASTTYPPRTYYYEPVCLQPSDVAQRSTANWVEQIDLVLRDGSRAEGRVLSLDATYATLDGRRIGYDDLARIELRHPLPFAPVVLGAKGALHVGAMGASVGLGVWAAEGDAAVLWQSTLTGAAIGGLGGAVIGLIRPSHGARDVTTLPEP